MRTCRAGEKPARLLHRSPWSIARGPRSFIVAGWILRRSQKTLSGRALGAEALPDFPGPAPTTLNTAYAYQDRAIALWPDNASGLEGGRIGAPWLERVGEDQLVGPIFRRGIRLAPPDAQVEFPVFKGGFAAVEPGFVFRPGADAEPDKTHWTIEEASRLVTGAHVGPVCPPRPAPEIRLCRRHRGGHRHPRDPHRGRAPA